MHRVLAHRLLRQLRSVGSASAALPAGSLFAAASVVPDRPNLLRVAVIDTGAAFRVVDEPLDEPNDAPLVGSPQSLLESWQVCLALRFDESMNVVPRWPVSGVRVRRAAAPAALVAAK